MLTGNGTGKAFCGSADCKKVARIKGKRGDTLFLFVIRDNLTPGGEIAILRAGVEPVARSQKRAPVCGDYNLSGLVVKWGL